MIVRIFVHQGVIKKNKARHCEDPPIWIKWYEPGSDRPVREELASEVKINGPAQMVYRPKNEIEPNASLWLELDEAYGFITFR